MNKQNLPQDKKQAKSVRAQSVTRKTSGEETAVSSPPPTLQHTSNNPHTLTAANAQTLQRTIGNQALSRLVTPRPKNKQEIKITPQHQSSVAAVLQRTIWTWDGTSWSNTEGKEKGAPKDQKGRFEGDQWDDEKQAFVDSPQKTPSPLQKKPPGRKKKPFGLKIIIPQAESNTAFNTAIPITQGLSQFPSGSNTKKKNRPKLTINTGQSPFATQTLQSVADYISKQQTQDYVALGGEEKFQIGLMAFKKLPPQFIEQLGKGDWWFHGSTASSLALLDRTEGVLKSAPQLLDLGLVPFGGEVGNALDDKAINKKGVSGVDRANLGEAVKYTDPNFERISVAKEDDEGKVELPTLLKSVPFEEGIELVLSATEGGNFSVGTSLNIGKLMVGIGRHYLKLSEEETMSDFALKIQGIASTIKPTTEFQAKNVSRFNEFLEKLFAQKPITPHQKMMVQANFPILYGASNLQEMRSAKRTTHADSSISGEEVVMAPEMTKDVSCVFAPLDEIGNVKQHLEGLKHSEVLVMPIEALHLVEDLRKGTQLNLLNVINQLNQM